MDFILGIAIAKRKFDVALRQGRQVLDTAEFANEATGYEALSKWLEKQGATCVHACLEATGRYAEGLANALHAQGHTVSIVNPARIHAYGRSKLRRNKNDQLDARLIADFCATQEPDCWTPPSAQRRCLQELTRELGAHKDDRLRKRNKLGSGLASPQTRRSLERQIDFLDQEIAQLEQEIAELIRDDSALDEDIQLLTSIPGIGLITAARFLAEVDVSLFRQASQVAAYAGLVPREFSSGSSVHKRARLSKVGNRHRRKAFYMPALSARRFNPLIQQLAQLLAERDKSKMAIIGAIMRKLIHLAFGVLKTRTPFDPHFLQNVPVGG
jgi:transposase